MGDSILLRNISLPWTLLAAFCIGSIFGAVAASPALAHTIITVNYTVGYLGLTIGSGRWQIEATEDQYAVSASGQVKGMVSMLINGQVSGSARGVVSKGDPVASKFDINVVSTAENDSVEVSFQSGVVKDLVALPPFPPLPKRVPVTESLLRGVIDPLSAPPIFVDIDSDVVPKACARRLPIFDGRRRYDVALAFKRVEDIAIKPTYRGTEIVCSAHLIPIAGQQVDSSTVKYLTESNKIEIAFAFIPEAHMLVPVGGSLPTLIGTIHVNPERIEVTISNTPDIPGIPHRRY